MPEVPTKRSGDILYAWEVNEIARQAGMGLTGSGARVVDLPGGRIVIVDEVAAVEDKEVIFCHGDSDIKQFGTAVLLDAEVYGVVSSYELPRHCGYSAVGIAEGPLSQSDGGEVRRSGIGWLCFNASSIPIRAVSPALKLNEVTVGDRLSVTRLKQYAEWNQSGPYEVIWSFQQVSPNAGIPIGMEREMLTRAGWPPLEGWSSPVSYRLALVKIHRVERGAGVRCVQYAPSVGRFFGNYYSIEMGSNIHIRESGVLQSGVMEVRVRG